MSAGPGGARVLVGIPTRNRPEFVKQAILSVVGQRFERWRLIISDNRSRPEASADVEAFVRELGDPRVHYYLQPVDGGEYGQGRYLFGECDEEYFVILHDDDCLEPTHLEVLLGVMDADPELAFAATGQLVVDEANEALPERTRSYHAEQGRDRFGEGRIDDVLETFLRYGGLFSITGAMFRSSAVRRNGLVDDDCGGLYPFEFNVFLRQAESRMPAYFTPRELVRYRLHEGAMRNYARPFFNRVMMSTMIKLLEKRRFSGWAEKRRSRLLAAVYRNYAYILYVAGERRDCYRFLSRAVRMEPFAWNIWAYAVFAVICPFLIRPIWGPRVTL